MTELKEISRAAARCVKCGNCLSQCPVYLETWEEPLVARGKLGLIETLEEGDGRLSKRLGQILSKCLLCGTCSESCPNGVPADEIIRRTRSALVARRGLSPAKRAFFRLLLKGRRLLPFLLKRGSRMQRLFLAKVPEESGLRLRFPLPYLDRRRSIPPLAAEFFLNRHSGWFRSEKEAGRVGLFVGCVGNFLFPSIPLGALNLLRRQGFSVYLPPEQGCCGLPAFGSGDGESPLSLARRNILAFEGKGLERVIVPCASCASMLKIEYPQLFPETHPFRSRAQSFSDLISETSQFLSPLLPDAPEGTPPGEKKRVTYHDPCHLRRKLGVWEEPRKLLRSLPGIEYVEMGEAGRCCGQGGSFNLAHYDLSLKILGRKIPSLEETGAQIVTTACSGCLLQLMDGLQGRGRKWEVSHIVELADRLAAVVS